MDNKNIGRIDISKLINVKLHDYSFDFYDLQYIYKISDLPKKTRDYILKINKASNDILLDGFLLVYLNNCNQYNDHDCAIVKPFVIENNNRLYYDKFDVYYGRKKATCFDNRYLLKQFYLEVKTNDLIRKDIKIYTKLLSNKLCYHYLSYNGYSDGRLTNYEEDNKYSFLINSLTYNRFNSGTGFYKLIKEKFYEIHGNYLQELLLTFDTLFSAVDRFSYMNKARVYSLDFNNSCSVKHNNLYPLIHTIKDLCFEELKQIKTILNVN